MTALYLFFKAFQPGLFDQQVQVSGHVTKRGTVVAPYHSTRKKRPEPPPGEDLFAQADRKAKEKEKARATEQKKDKSPSFGTVPREKFKPDDHYSPIVLLPPILYRNGSTSITCDAGRFINIPPKFQKAIRSALETLIPLCRLSSDNIEIRFTTQKELGKDNVGKAGGKTARILSGFVYHWIRNGINNKGAAIAFLEILCHEITHLWQEARGDLGYNDKAQKTWKGEARNKNGVLYQKLAWAARPWEREANRLQGIFAARVIDDLVGQGILDPSLSPATETAEPRCPNVARDAELAEEKAELSKE